MDYRHNLIVLAERMGAARGISEARVANLAGCDGNFFSRLRKGRSCRVDTMLRLAQYFSDNWPENASWPDGVERIAPLNGAAA